jgi:hypothetical protein
VVLPRLIQGVARQFSPGRQPVPSLINLRTEIAQRKLFIFVDGDVIACYGGAKLTDKHLASKIPLR